MLTSNIRWVVSNGLLTLQRWSIEVVGAEQTQFMFIVGTFVVRFPLNPFISILSICCIHIVGLTYHSVILSSNKTVIAFSSIWTGLALSYGSLPAVAPPSPIPHNPIGLCNLSAYLYYLPIM